MARTRKVKVEHREDGAAVNYSPKELKVSIQGWVERIWSLKDQRAAINADIVAARAEAKAAGINVHALNAAMAYAAMSPDVRTGFDFSYDLARDAVGLPYQQGELGLEGQGAPVHDD